LRKLIKDDGQVLNWAALGDFASENNYYSID